MNRIFSCRRIFSRGVLLSMGGVLLATAATAQSSDGVQADREALRRQLQEMDMSPEGRETASSRRSDLLLKADANSDGVLTRAELQRTLQNKFSRLDRNKDGVASASDAPKFAGRNRFDSALSQLMAKLDANGDEMLSFTEFSERALNGFASIDDDGDGQIELGSIAARFNATSPEGEG